MWEQSWEQAQGLWQAASTVPASAQNRLAWQACDAHRVTCMLTLLSKFDMIIQPNLVLAVHCPLPPPPPLPPSPHSHTNTHALLSCRTWRCQLNRRLAVIGHAVQVAAELSRVPPLELLVPCRQPWQGLLSLERVVDRLQALLPPTFEELPQQFAVGVVTRQGQHMLIDSGPLPEAVAASAAIPFIFGPVAIPGEACYSSHASSGLMAEWEKEHVRC